MKAWTARRYGGPEVLRLEDLPKPQPRPGEVLVRIRATTVNSADRRIRACDLPPGMNFLGRLALGWNGPRNFVLGTEYAGVVEAVGQGVTRFQPGDAVFAFPGGSMGAHAEYAVIPETGRIVPLPEGLDFQTAAALSFGGTTALHFLRAANVQPGDAVLVLGGSGAVGIALIQIAAHRGAVVTATISAANADLVRAAGATTVIDYHAIDVSTLPQRFDMIADAVAAMDFATAQTLLKPDGRYLAIAGGMREMLGSLRKGGEGKRMLVGPASERVEDLSELAQLALSGHYRPHIDKVYAFADLPAAHAHVDTGRKRGSVVVTVAD